MVPLNLNLKLACIFHTSLSIFCKLANNPAHARKFVVSGNLACMPFELEYHKLACLSILFIKFAS